MIRILVVLILITATILYLTANSLFWDSDTTKTTTTMAAQNNNNNNASPNRFKIVAKNRGYFGFDDTERTEWNGEFTFVVCADTQLGAYERLVLRRENSGWHQDLEWTREMVREVNSMHPRPKFVVILGDLVDAHPYPHQASTRVNQILDLKQALVNLEVPLVCVSGNHDVGDSPTPQGIADYVHEFGDDYYSFMIGGVYFLVLNSQLFKNGSMSEGLSEQQYEWLDSELDKIVHLRPKHAIVLMHIPPFVQYASEGNAYFSLDSNTRIKLLEKFRLAGIKYVFNGHLHKNGGGAYRGVRVVISSAVGAQFGSDMNGYRVVKVYEDSIEHFYKVLDSANGL